MTQKNEQAVCDRKIDAALRSLAEVPVPAAMTSRIHRSLEVAAAADGSGRFRWQVWAPAACAAVGILLVAVVLQGHVRRGMQRPAGETVRIAAADGAPARLDVSHAAQLSAESSLKRGPAVRMVPATVHARKFPRYRHAENLLNYPLTRQEKLLVRFARTATPAELQMLNPEYQAKIEAQQEAAFAAYVNSGDDSGAAAEASATNSNTSQE
ncbi:MAG: hypothetical protein WA708_03930 [Acidobacteriaceae bacterium]